MVDSARSLSEDEVEALLQSAEKDTHANNRASIEHVGPVSEFRFGDDDLSLLGDFHALRIINEKFARLVRVIFQPLLHIQPRINCATPAVKSYGDYCDTISKFMSLSTSRVEELRGSIMVVMPPELISMATDTYYGGALKQPQKISTEFTGTERRILEILTEDIKETLAKAWQDLTPTTFSETSFEENPQFASFVDGQESIVVCRFEVSLPDIDPLNIDVLYPIQTLKPVASKLRSQVQTAVGESDLTWTEKLQAAVSEIPINMSAVLVESKIQISKLTELLEGGTMTVAPPDNLKIKISNRTYFNGDMGEIDGCRAVSITEKVVVKTKKQEELI